MKIPVVLTALALVLSFPSPAQAASPRPPATVRLMEADGTVRAAFKLATANAATGFTVASADLGEDGVPELIFGAGLGNAPEVIVTRQDGSEIGRFLAYAPTSGMGINVAACDLDGDGTPEIVTAAQRGGGPHVRVFDNFGQAEDGGGFFAYDAADRNGVNLACGDLDGDAADELVTLPAAGAAPLVRVWDLSGGTAARTQEFYALSEDDRRGVVGVVHDQALTVSSQHASRTAVRTFAFASPAHLADETEFDDAATGVTGVLWINGEAILSSSSGSTLIDAFGATFVTVADAPFGSVHAAVADLEADGTAELVVVDGKPAFTNDPSEKSIVVDLSEQRLYAYERGILTNTFLVSTARKGWVTPPGKHVILAKVPLVHYAGPGWDLGIIPYNLRFLPHYYIHYAPWNRAIGVPISHGCVNADLEGAKWIYDWGDAGIPMEVRT
ncbi:hypothetical protein EPO34_03105 [Patescibacteria group bacterium]|nr:MAG: hypothetical protein EPO34_03105 [Patescibacteria group bacterium]